MTSNLLQTVLIHGQLRTKNRSLLRMAKEKDVKLRCVDTLQKRGHVAHSEL